MREGGAVYRLQLSCCRICREIAKEMFEEPLVILQPRRRRKRARGIGGGGGGLGGTGEGGGGERGRAERRKD